MEAVCYPKGHCWFWNSLPHHHHHYHQKEYKHKKSVVFHPAFNLMEAVCTEVWSTIILVVLFISHLNGSRLHSKGAKDNRKQFEAKPLEDEEPQHTSLRTIASPLVTKRNDESATGRNQPQ
jgi:hypothetical protein